MLVPNDQFKTDEENEKMILLNEDVYTEEKEYPLPAYDTLKTKEAWVHLHPNIMSTGRCSHYVPSGLTEE